MSEQSAADVIAEALRAGVPNPEWVWADEVAAILAALEAAGYTIVKLPQPNSTRYEGDEHEPMDRLGWWRPGSLFGVTQWGYPNQVQIAFDGEPFEPLSVDEARFIGLSLLAAAREADNA